MSTWLWWLGQNTITVALVLPFVLLACRLFRERPAVQHVLWVVVLVKFLTPPIVSWPWSVEQMGAAIWSTPASGSVEEAAALLPAPERDGPANFTKVPEIPADPNLAERPVNADLVARRLAKPSEPGVTPFSEPRSTRTSLPLQAKTSLLVQALAATWLLGVILCGLVQLRRIIRHAAFVRRGTTAPAQLTTEVEAAAKRLGMRPPLAVLARGIISPFVWCLGHLRLVWPESLANATAIARSRGIIAHELAHVRRCDHWVAWLELVAGIVWWWNPLYWYVRRRLRETAEMACDALAIATSPGNRQEYAEMLLELSAGFKNGAPAPVLAVGAGAPSSFERRLSMILSDRVSGKMSSFGILSAIGLAIVAMPSWSLGQPAPLADQNREVQSDRPPAAEAPVKAPQKQEQEKEGFTAWGEELAGRGLHMGEEVDGLQAGLGFRPGEKRAYSHGETVKLVVRVRNVGKKEVAFKYIPAYFFDHPPSAMDGAGKAAPKIRLATDGHEGEYNPKDVTLAPGKEIDLAEVKLELRPESESGNKKVNTLYGNGKFQIHYERLMYASGRLDIGSILSSLATGKLELEIKPKPPATPEKK